MQSSEHRQLDRFQDGDPVTPLSRGRRKEATALVLVVGGMLLAVLIAAVLAP